ncbi:MAG: hypothetical protein HYZ53_29470 [Planctomycetes bacterium]|nr:hypothetical protein [Planctomycetota bacterium]
MSAVSQLSIHGATCGVATALMIWRALWKLGRPDDPDPSTTRDAFDVAGDLVRGVWGEPSLALTLHRGTQYEPREIAKATTGFWDVTQDLFANVAEHIASTSHALPDSGRPPVIGVEERKWTGLTPHGLVLALKGLALEAEKVNDKTFEELDNLLRQKLRVAMVVSIDRNGTIGGGAGPRSHHWVYYRGLQPGPGGQGRVIGIKDPLRLAMNRPFLAREEAVEQVRLGYEESGRIAVVAHER